MSSGAIRKGLTRSVVRRRRDLGKLCKPDIRMSAIVTVVLGLTFPAVCSATLPDGRVYEEASPANKNGNVVVKAFFGLSAEDGNAVVFVGTGGMGAASSSGIGDSVSRRSAAGWQTSSAVSPALGNVAPLSRPPLTLVPSQDFSRFLFGASAPYVSAEPLEALESVNIFLSSDPTMEPEWVGQPTAQTPGFNPLPPPGQNVGLHDYLIAGATPSLSSVYFTYSGTLIPQDAPRTPNVGDGKALRTDAWGFYEWSAGRLSEAGVLPNGTLDPFGAIPAALAGANNFQRVFANPFDQAQTLDNEISTDGKRAFFVSPDPVASTVTDAPECAEAGPCTSAAPELYVRETGPDGTKNTVLVSQSQLPGHEGEEAPDGPTKIADAPNERFRPERAPAGETYVYASPDGSQAFFASVDRLTSEAPSDGSVKEYDFNVDTGSLTYLPGVTGPVVTSANDGSSFIFENTAATPAELDLWRRGAGGGHVTTIAQLPVEPGPALDVDGARATADGSAFVFRTNSSLPGGFNNSGGSMQVYRFESATEHLDCVSCPPAGITPSGDARVSYNNAGTGITGSENGGNGDPMSTLDTRALSADGSRVFFDTPAPLVPQDSNEQRDVYEWENGKVFLVSSGKSNEESIFLDASANGNDVFFKTSLGLVPGDRDTGYDVYDARVPRPGDNPPPSAVPCQGDVCQGPPSVPFLLGAPPSATFSGIGNITSSEVQRAGATPLTRAQALAKALKACRAKRPKRKRHRCEAQAKRAYAPPAMAKKTERRVK